MYKFTHNRIIVVDEFQIRNRTATFNTITFTFDLFHLSFLLDVIYKFAGKSKNYTLHTKIFSLTTKALKTNAYSYFA